MTTLPLPVNAPTSTPRLLLVEDDEDLVELLLDAFDEQPVDIQIFPTPDKAIQALDAGVTVDLILTDYRFPGSLTGMDLVEHARRLRPTLPIVMTTGFDQEYLQAPTADHFHLFEKPYSPFQLRTFILNLLQDGV